MSKAPLTTARGNILFKAMPMKRMTRLWSKITWKGKQLWKRVGVMGQFRENPMELNRAETLVEEMKLAGCFSDVP